MPLRYPFTLSIHPSSIQVRFHQLPHKNHLGTSLKGFGSVGKRDLGERGDAGLGACRAGAPSTGLSSKWKIPVR